MEKGEIWLLDFFSKRGKEQSGIRPSLILADTKTDLIIASPLTSNMQASKLPFSMQIKKSDKNSLNKDSVALILQIQTVDKKRLIHKIGILEENYLKQIDETIKKMLGF